MVIPIISHIYTSYPHPQTGILAMDRVQTSASQSRSAIIASSVAFCVVAEDGINVYNI